MTAQTQFQWKCQPKAETILLKLLDESCKMNPTIEKLKNDLLKHTSTRLFDWVDHFVVGYTQEIEHDLEESGFVSESVTSSYRIMHHPGAQLPRVVIKDNAGSIEAVAVTVDNIADFLMVRGLSGTIEGTPLSTYRRCNVSTDGGVSLYVVERRGTNTMEPTHENEKYVVNYLSAKEMWQTRPRNLADEDEAMKKSFLIVQKMIELVGQNIAAWIVLEVERAYWQSRNMAGQLQKNRQDQLGMGWANHDHHTFRSSRRHFIQLVRLFETLGFYTRERFYAGKEAGWGAQVMEHHNARLVLFLDVDLLPHEIEIDFRHENLPELDKLSTVGLWCALHGDSILQAGMHHLEAQFMFDELTEDLAKMGVVMMQPFSSFPFLHQAFTKGENWLVETSRVNKLVKQKLITKEQADKFLSQGAIGSHMENLQRREGYKGFNQSNVSTIIRKTDPRNINF